MIELCLQDVPVDIYIYINNIYIYIYIIDMCMVENIIDSTAGVRENGLGGHVPS